MIVKKNWEEGISRQLITESELKTRIAELGAQITEDYKNTDEELIVVGLLKGSLLFMADLIREIDKAIEDKKVLSPDKLKISKLQSKIEELEQSLENALGRELSLLYENYQLKKQVSELTGCRVLPLRPQSSKS